MRSYGPISRAARLSDRRLHVCEPKQIGVSEYHLPDFFLAGPLNQRGSARQSLAWLNPLCVRK